MRLQLDIFNLVNRKQFGLPKCEFDSISGRHHHITGKLTRYDPDRLNSATKIELPTCRGLHPLSRQASFLL
jgi:hypothetical protein